MPAKKKVATSETVSVKSEAEDSGPPKLIAVWAKFAEIIDRLEKLETTVDAIRRDYKGKGVPMP